MIKDNITLEETELLEAIQRIQFIDIKYKGIYSSDDCIVIPTRWKLIIQQQENSSHRTPKVYKLFDSPEIPHLISFHINFIYSNKLNPHIYLLPGFGKIFLVENKEIIQKGKSSLSSMIELLKRTHRSRIRKRILEVTSIIVDTIIPFAQQTAKYQNIPIDVLRKTITEDIIERNFGSIKDYINNMSVTILITNVTTELLNDEKFLTELLKYRKLRESLCDLNFVKRFLSTHRYFRSNK